ncbi:MAG: DUF3159 domain-containing protein [Microbacteriaceae bacterium]
MSHEVSGKANRPTVVGAKVAGESTGDASVAEALSAAARKAGIGQVAPGEAPTGSALLSAIGGVRGIIESILPGLVFLIVYTITQELLPSVLIPVGVGAFFVAARVISGTTASSAIVGLVGIGASAVLAIISGRAVENFLLGFYINAAWIVALSVSLVVRWPIIGIVVGLLRGEGSSWRDDKAKFRVAVITTVLWLTLFSTRLAVQMPLYFADEAQLLGATKLIMGLPLYAAVLWVTWLLVSAVYKAPQPRKDSRPEEGSQST